MQLHLILYLFFLIRKSQQSQPPHIIVIIGDDIGSSDLGYRGSNEILTPNIDAMGYNGVILENFYTVHSCTPSRAAFLTGQYPIRYGLQGYATIPGEIRDLPLNITIMSEYLNRLRYKSHIVGKWHLGFSHIRNTPIGRGFESHLGHWNGYTGYFDYRSSFGENGTLGFDLHNPLAPDFADDGIYATDLYTEKAVDVINNHNAENNSLFLILAHQAAHVGHGVDDLAVKNINATNMKYSYIKNPRRRRYAEIVNSLDTSVGKVFEKLGEKNMLNNSIVLFFSDNGGPTIGSNSNTGSNWPLRGIKNTYFQGGIKGTAILFSPLFQKTGYVNTGLIHLVDFLPTFYRIAGGNTNDLGTIDGIDQWETISENEISKRDNVLVDIDEVFNYSSIITNAGRYKLMAGNFDYDAIALNASAHHGEDGATNEMPPYKIEAVLTSSVNVECEKLLHTTPIENKVDQLRRKKIVCNYSPPEQNDILDCSNPVCLFDLEDDPCEFNNIAEEKPQRVIELLLKIDYYSKQLVPQAPRFAYNSANDPQLYNYTWCTFEENNWCTKTINVSDINSTDARQDRSCAANITKQEFFVIIIVVIVFLNVV